MDHKQTDLCVFLFFLLIQTLNILNAGKDLDWLKQLCDVPQNIYHRLNFFQQKKYIKFIYIDMKRLKIGIWYTNL